MQVGSHTSIPGKLIVFIDYEYTSSLEWKIKVLPPEIALYNNNKRIFQRKQSAECKEFCVLWF